MNGGKVVGIWICEIWAVVEDIGLIGMLFVLLLIVSSSELDVSSITSNVEHDGDDDCDDWKKPIKQKKRD
jgi:hypothetical protein